MTHLDWALLYAGQYGWKVFPVHGVRFNERGQLECCCGAGDGCDPKNRGKHPATPNGFKDAVSLADSEGEIRIRAWWSARPDANIGVATGRGSGIFVVDVDVKNGDGPGALAAWWASVNEKPWHTLSERSGSGGHHWVFAYPEDGEKVPSRNGWLSSVDVKSDGGYVVVAPSRIPAGDYRWVSEGLAPAYPSDTLLEAVRSGGSSSGPSGFTADVQDMEFLNGNVPEGKRNDLFFHYSMEWLRKCGGDQNMVLGLLQMAWERMPEASRESFSAEEVIKTFRSALERWNRQQQEGVINDAWIKTYMSGAMAGFEGEFGDGLDEELRRGLPPPAPLDVTVVEGGLITAPDGFPMTDVGNAQRLMAVYGPYVRHTTGIGWLAWDGTRWSRETADKTLERYAKAVVRSLLVDFVPKLREREIGDDVIKRVMNHWRVSESSGRLRAMVELSGESADWPMDGWDGEDMLFNCVNGTVDLATGMFRSHAPGDYITKMSGVRYAEGERAPRWEAFMERMLPVEEVRRYVQKAIGYSLSGSVDEKCFFILFGGGNNGKTLFTQTVGMLMGEYWNAAPKSVFIGYGTKQESHPTDLAGIAGARYVTSAEEVTRQDHLAESRIKSMTGGNTMKARFMHRDFFEFDFKGKLWLDTNYRPRLSDFSDALRERIRLVPWEVVIPEAERRGRSEMMAEFAAELPGIFNWALEGAKLWVAEGLTQPDVVREATAEYVHDENLIAQFVEDCTTEGGWTTSAAMYQAYQYWLYQQGGGSLKPLAIRNFGVALRECGLEPVKMSGQRGWSCGVTTVPTDWVG